MADFSLRKKDSLNESNVFGMYTTQTWSVNSIKDILEAKSFPESFKSSSSYLIVADFLSYIVNCNIINVML